MADTHAVTEGEKVTYEVANHPGRENSPEYERTRKWLMTTSAGCVVCGGPVDLRHPEAPADKKGMEDHHGGGIYVGDVLVGLNLFPLEWSQGWGADPQRVQQGVEALNKLMEKIGQETYDKPIETVDDIMAWVDSRGNANVKLCAVHHRSTDTQDSPDAQGHQGVGIHHIPGPVFWGQISCWWDRFDMWGGTTGTVAVAPTGKGAKDVEVLHVSAAHPDTSLYLAHRAAQEAGKRHILPASHPHARLAHAGHYRAA